MEENNKVSGVLGKEYESNMDRTKRKTYGSFYTPDFIVDYIIENTINNLDVVENPFVKVLDPSCGVGYFLIRVYDTLIDKFNGNIDCIRDKYLEEEYSIELDGKLEKLRGKDYWNKENLNYHILKHCIYGADIDHNAVEITKLNLKSKGKCNLELSSNIVCCDSLIKWEEDYDLENVVEVDVGFFVCIHKNLEGIELKVRLNENEIKALNSIYNFWKQKYDYIIGNPPWVSLNRKHKQNIEIKLMNYYMSKYDGNKYLPNLYEYFIKRAFISLKSNGRVGFVVPDRFAKNLQYKSLRKEILNNYNLVNLIFEIDFPDINTDSMIFILEKRYIEDNKISLNIFNKRKYSIYQNEYLKNQNYEFDYENRSDYGIIKKKIESKSKFLGDISTTFTGFIGNTKKITSEIINNFQVEILKGENIKKFSVLNNYYYEFIPENLKGGTKNITKLACPLKIVVRKTGNKIIAALDTRGYLVEQSLYGIINLNDEFSYKYVLGILNSRLMEWYYLNFLVTNINSTPQIKKYSLNKIPIKCCNKRKQKIIENLVDKIFLEVESHKSNNYVYTKNKNLKENEKLNTLQSQLDYEIFNLYNIDNEDIKYIDLSNS